MSEPTTAAGRALLEGYALPNMHYFALELIAVEHEAVVAYLASPEAVEELTRALYQHMADFATEPESYGDPAKVAVNILAALRDQRGAS